MCCGGSCVPLDKHPSIVIAINIKENNQFLLKQKYIFFDGGF